MTLTADHQALLTAALAYAARGWHVFPCHTPTPEGCDCHDPDCHRIGKHPRTEHGLNDATTDEAKIRRWWRMWPTANVAIRTGAVSGLVAVDVDPPKGGAESLTDLEQSYHPLPETVQQLTGRGQHYVFAHPGVYVKSGVDTVGPGLDIRGDGGYILAAPSLHETGRRYIWEVLHEPDDTPLAPLPDWLLALCQASTGREAASAGEPIPAGQRNETLFRLGCSFRARGCTEAVLLAALLEMNVTQCQPPLPEAEVRTIAASCAKYEMGLSDAGLSQRRNGDTPPPTEDGPLPYSDYTNALAFVAAHGGTLRYCYPWKAWLVWTGSHWQRDTSGEVMRLAKQTIKRLARRVEHLEDEKKIAALMAHIKSSLSTAKLKAMLESAQSEPGIAVQPDELDRDIWLLNCTNGTLDLRTGALRPHAQDDLLTKCLPFPYEPARECPQWLHFLEKAMHGSAELIAFIQKALGYSLTGSTREQCFFLLHGPTKTGKSTFATIAKALLGPYGTQAEMSAFLHKDRETVRNDLADLAGMRLVCAIETDEGKRLAEALIKQLTGGTDTIKARFLFEEYFEYRPQFKIFLATNHKPKVTAADDAVWERIRLIPFTVQIPKDERDKQLEEKLRAELPGILAWAVRGCQTWQHADGLGEPTAVVEATQQYRDEMDDIGQFLDTCLVGDPAIYKTQATVLFKAYQQWGGKQCETQHAFGKALGDRGHESKRRGSGYFWLGIGLHASGQDEDERSSS
jgi:putative DNA primase/helicase